MNLSIFDDTVIEKFHTFLGVCKSQEFQSLPQKRKLEAARR
jgi:hypothetical protein